MFLLQIHFTVKKLVSETLTFCTDIFLTIFFSLCVQWTCVAMRIIFSCSDFILFSTISKNKTRKIETKKKLKKKIWEIWNLISTFTYHVNHLIKLTLRLIWIRVVHIHNETVQFETIFFTLYDEKFLTSVSFLFHFL